MKLGRFAAALLLSGTLAQAKPGPVQTAPQVDLQRYAGTWFELARIPNRFQKSCARDVQASYALDGGKIDVTNTCVKADGSVTAAHGKAKVVDTATNAKLKVTFFWPFYGDYWILGLDPEYRWAVVGGPDRKYLWILSRTRVLPKEQMTQALAIAERNGYATSALVTTPQDAK